MTKQLSAIAVAACTALSTMGMPTALAKQQCSVATRSHPHGFWSWRFIDGRKCWYEGKPGLSKSLLEWPAQASVQPAADGELASAPTESPSNPLDSQAWAPTGSETFEALAREGGTALGRCQLDRLALLALGIIDLDLEHWETPLQLSGRFQSKILRTKLPLSQTVHNECVATRGKTVASPGHGPRRAHSLRALLAHGETPISGIVC